MVRAVGTRANCPAEPGPDFDFASSAILTSGSDGREILLAGQESGIVYALDPARKGEIVWQTRVGMAADGERLYAPVADTGRSRQSKPLDTRRFTLDPRKGGGVTALRIVDESRGGRSRKTAAGPESARRRG